MADGKILIQYEFPTDANGMDAAVKLLKLVDGQNLNMTDTPPAQPQTAKTKTKAPAPAAAPPPKSNGKTKAAAPAKAAAPKQDDLLDLTGGDDAAEDEDQDSGLGLADDLDTEAEDKKFETPGDAKEEALGRLRIMLANGHKAQVKEVQMAMKVAKFHDVPAAQGYEFLKVVKRVEAKIQQQQQQG